MFEVKNKIVVQNVFVESPEVVEKLAAHIGAGLILPKGYLEFEVDKSALITFVMKHNKGTQLTWFDHVAFNALLVIECDRYNFQCPPISLDYVWEDLPGEVLF